MAILTFLAYTQEWLLLTLKKFLKSTRAIKAFA